MAQPNGPSQRRRPTLSDVAKLAGVSPTLASMVMRDAPGAGAESRARVLQAARQLDYRPDPRARALAGHRSKLIGVVWGLVGAFYLDVLDGLYTEARGRGYEIILSAVTTSHDEETAVRSLYDFNLDALIMLAHSYHPVLAGKLPLVVVGWQVDDPAVDVVMTSNEQGMDMAISHLAAAGHQRIMHIDGGDNPVSQARRTGYEHAMKKNGLDAFIQIERGGITELEGAIAARNILTHPNRPTAIMAFNDETAAGAIEVMRLQGLNIPTDMSVVGWNNGPTAKLPYVQLTTVNQDTKVMAKAILDRLIDRIEGVEIDTREIILDTELVVRDTTAPVPSTE